MATGLETAARRRVHESEELGTRQITRRCRVTHMMQPYARKTWTVRSLRPYTVVISVSRTPGTFHTRPCTRAHRTVCRGCLLPQAQALATDGLHPRHPPASLPGCCTRRRSTILRRTRAAACGWMRRCPRPRLRLPWPTPPCLHHTGSSQQALTLQSHRTHPLRSAGFVAIDAQTTARVMVIFRADLWASASGGEKEKSEIFTVARW